jgi:hypothetical protein
MMQRLVLNLNDSCYELSSEEIAKFAASNGNEDDDEKKKKIPYSHEEDCKVNIYFFLYTFWFFCHDFASATPQQPN